MEGAFGDRLGARFGVRNVPALVTTTINKTPIAVTLIQSEAAADVRSEPLPVEDAFLVHLNLKPCPDHELWIDGRSLGKRTFGRGESVIHDLKRSPVAHIRTPMGSLMFYLSRKLLDEICDDTNAPRIEGLHWTPGVSVDDPVIRGLGQTLLTAMDRPQEASALFVDHMTMALAVHVATAYGEMRPGRLLLKGGLTPHQERQAKALLMNNLDGSISLSDLARECGLSVSHFSRLFRQSVGEPPHRWLMRQRVEQAKALMGDMSLDLADVATACGYCDQSHLARNFKTIVGVSPSIWRRNHFG